MTTTTTTAVTATAAGPILAIDLGKYKCVAGAYDQASAQARFTTIDTSRPEVEGLIRRTRPAVVVVEACSLAGWVHDLCAELGVPCQVANTGAEAWKYKHAKRKTDRDDALRLAQLFALGQLPEVVVPPKAVREWRALIAHRQALITRRVAAQNRIRSVLGGQGLPAPRGARAWTQTGLSGIGQLARPLADCGPDELWRGMLDLALTDYRQADDLARQAEAKLDAIGRADPGVQLLATAPGVGPRTAEAVVAYLGDPRRFQSAKQVSAYSGLVPRQHQSGEDDRRGRITKRGPAVLRKLLVQCAWAALRYNPWAAAVYKRLSRGQARKKQAIIAVARKLLVRCWAMLRDSVPWRAEPVPAA
jgi:transposase